MLHSKIALALTMHVDVSSPSSPAHNLVLPTNLVLILTCNLKSNFWMMIKYRTSVADEHE
jgi:hypothetical protein